MFLSKSNTTDLDTRSVTKAAKRAQKAGSAAASNAAKSAQNAATAAQNAANLAQTAAQHAAAVATERAHSAASVASDKAQNAAAVAADKAQAAVGKAHSATGALQSAAGVAQAKAQTAVSAAASAAQNASSAAQNASDAAQSATSALSKNVADKVFVARKWAAPRLESAADYTANTVAPKVSSALRSTAKQVSPPEPEKSGRRVLTWTLLAAGIAAGLGAAAALFRYRLRTAIAADSEVADEEVLAESEGLVTPVTPDTADGAAPAQGDAADPGTDSSANGRVKATGW